VCLVLDDAERAQPDLHMACVERATDRAKKKQANRNATRRANAGTPLTHDELVTRLALERAGLVGGSGRRSPRGGSPDRLEERDEDEEDGLTSEEVAHIEMITRGGGLSTEGLAGEGVDG
jgi:hypothetical protein